MAAHSAQRPRESQPGWPARLSVTRLWSMEYADVVSCALDDCDEITLPKSQVDYIKELAGYDVKIVLVITGGSPLR